MKTDISAQPSPLAGPQKFRKKPVVIEAIQFNYNYTDIAAFVPAENLAYNTLQHKVFIQTLEGTMAALPGDWIIKGVRGEFYPCKPDIFAATYEPVEKAGAR